MTIDDRHLLVVGAGAAGLSAAETLRRRGFAGRLSVLGAEPHRPYDRPPLSKQVLSGQWEGERTALRVSVGLDDVDWLLGDPAVGLSLDDRRLETASGRVVAWDGLVLAPGVRARRLPFGHDLPGVHVLRTLDDALTLREALGAARSVVVVGAGFLGCEIAAAARGAGLPTTLVDTLATPMERHLGPTLGALLARVHEEQGVRLELGRSVAAVEGRSRVERVVLDGGTELEADVVVVAVGGVPDVEWLRDSGIGLGDGIECDARLRAAPGIVAAGDAASWVNPLFGRRMRVEHRFAATEQGAAAAATLLGEGEDLATVPYFWSDQFDVRLQAHGLFGAAHEVEVVAGDPAERRFAAVLHEGDGVPVAGVAWNLPKEQLDLRRRVVDAATARASAAGASVPVG